jgi:hypothetical protein
MGPLVELHPTSFDILGWGIQILLIAAIRSPGVRTIRLRSPGISFCILVLAMGWIVRLAYLFVLASGGFKYWIGDDPARFMAAWEWSRFGEIRRTSAWMPGTYYLHGLAMSLGFDPLYSSKFVSVVYPVMSLAGVFAFAQAVFRDRVLSIACVIFLAPFWIDVLLSSGTMTEMPIIGAMLAGTGAFITALRAPLSPRRTLLLLGAALCFVVATMFHLVAWFQLAGILLFTLPVFMMEPHGPVLSRFRSWSIFSAGSSAYCFFYVAERWITTGDPFRLFRRVRGGSVFKIGGPTETLDAILRVATPGDFAILGAALLSFMLLIGLSTRVLVRHLGGIGRRGPVLLWTLRAVAASLAIAFFALSLGTFGRWLDAVPARQLELVLENWLVYPASLLYCTYYYAPLVIHGVVTTFSRNRPSLPKVVLTGIGGLLMILIASAISGGANLSPFRTVLTLSTALVPFTLAPFFGRRPDDVCTSESVATTPRLSWLVSLLLLLAFVQIASANHLRVFSELTGPSILLRPTSGPGTFRSDTLALGAWLRAEMENPGHLSKLNLSQPIRYSVAIEYMGYKRMVLKYYVGDPGRVSAPDAPSPTSLQARNELVESLAPGQILVTDYVLDDARLRPVIQIGQYFVFEAADR